MISTRSALVTASETHSDSLFSRLAFGVLLSLLLMAPSQLSGFWPASYDFWPQTMWLLLGAGVTLLLALSPESRPHFDATGKLLLAFLGWSALSIATAIYRHDAWLEWARVFGALSTFFVVRAVWSEKRALWIIGDWVLGVAWMCFPALENFLQTRYPRQAGPYSNNNLFANALAMTLPLALIFPVLVWRRFRNIALAALASLPLLVCAAGLLVTSSKGGFLAALVALGVTTGALWRAKNRAIRAVFGRHRAVLVAALLIFGLGFGILAAKMIAPRVQQALGAEKNSTMFRVYIWRSTLDMALEKPLLGFGPGAFPHVYPRFARVSYSRHAHQSWIQIAAENGWPALLSLLGAVAVALKSGLKRLQTRDWPWISGASGAVAAMLVHGSVDSGFQTASIAIFLAIALALLTATDADLTATDLTATDLTARAPDKPGSRLGLFWIGATLLLVLGGNFTQKAARGEEARFQAEQFARNGAPSVAAGKMREATALDPTSARSWAYLGSLQEESGQDGRAALQTAADLQPTRGSNHANLARAALEDGDVANAEKLYARALEQAPLDTGLRLERAQFLLGAKNSAGYADLEAILALKTRPLGLYEPIEQIVNLDFARATWLLAPELRRRKQTARLNSLLAMALADCARARRYVAQNEATRREMGIESARDDNADLESLAAALEALQTVVK